ncbi:MAG: CHAT domain-containing protein [Theionarchaea archaeon]|nr:CHAT domain-containing protein [Theionarchaea archaeon]
MKQSSWVLKMRSILLMVLFIFLILTVSQTEGEGMMWSHAIEGISSFSVSKNGSYIAVGCLDGYFYLFDSTGRTLGKGSVPAPVVSLDIANTGDLIIGSGTGFTICNKYGNHISSFLSFNVQTVSISDSGMDSFVCSQENLFINHSYSMISQLQISGENPFGSISSDGRIACAASDELLHVYKEGSFVDPIELESPVRTLFLSQDGENIIFSLHNKIGILRGDGNVEYIDAGSVITSISAHPETGTCVVTTEDRILWFEEREIVFQEDITDPIQILDLSRDTSYAVVKRGDSEIETITHTGHILFSFDFRDRVIDAHCTGNALAVYTQNGLYWVVLHDFIKDNSNFLSLSSRTSLPLDPPIDEAWSLPVSDDAAFVTGDPDGDGYTEIIVKEGSTLTLIDETGRIEEKRDLEILFSLCRPMDCDGDIIQEIPLIFQNSIYTYSFYDWKENRLRDYFLDSIRDDPSQTGQARPFMSFEYNDRPAILASLSAGYSCRPRGLIAVDQKSGEILWVYRTGPGVLPDVVDDIDEDGIKEIIIGSVAPCNCPEDHLYPDCEAFIYAVSCLGEEKWAFPVGTGYKRVSVMVADILEQPGKEIIGFCYEASENWGRLLCISSTGEVLHDTLFDCSIFPGAVGDIDDDGTMEIITLDSLGFLTIFSSDLQQERRVYIDENLTSTAHLLVSDIDGDGTRDIIFWHESLVLLFKGDLSVLWEKRFDTRVSVDVIPRSGCKNALIVLADDLHAFCFTGPQEIPCPLWDIQYRVLSEQADSYEVQAESLFSSGEYRKSKKQFLQAHEIYSQLHDEEKELSLTQRLVTVSIIIFKDNIKMGIFFLSVVTGLTLLILFYFWIGEHRWLQGCEQLLLGTMPHLFGLARIYATPSQEYFSLFIASTVPLLVLSSVVLLRTNILGFARAISAYLGGHKDMLVLSITRSNTHYQVSVESIEEKFNPVKESQEIPFSPEKKSDLVGKVEFMIEVLNQVPSQEPDFLDHAQNMLLDIGKTIYEHFIPSHFVEVLNTKFLLLEVEDTEIPWELMVSHDFFALNYAISRRIVSNEAVTVRQAPVKGRKRALVISDPSGDLGSAHTECSIITRRLNRKMDTVVVEGETATVRRIAHLLGQGFDIIHFAGHIENSLVLSDGNMGFGEVREFLVGTPIVFMNGCKSEDLTKAFLLGGAKVYVGTIHPIHDHTAAGIAADFYDLCFQYPIGEALRRARKLHVTSSIAWASLIMYGDPTLTLW